MFRRTWRKASKSQTTRVLSMLGDGRWYCYEEVAAAFGLNLRATTHVVDDLVNQGLVEKGKGLRRHVRPNGVLSVGRIKAVFRARPETPKPS